MNKILNFLRTESLDLENMDWYNFMGFCDFHRLSGYLAGKLEKYNLPPQVKRHFGIQKEYQAYRQEHLFRAAKEIENALVRENIAHAFLKGTAENCWNLSDLHRGCTGTANSNVFPAKRSFRGA